MRCSKCILPDTVPEISFNDKKVCNFCDENFPSYFPKGDESLAKLLQDNIRNGSSADCLVGLSGGKDSTHALISLKEEFNMRVEAFTYIHDGSTAFSIENAKSTCKKLNVKHHIVSLDKQGHLKTFKGFFEAWIKSPSLTTAGMACVACKNLHVLGFKLASERNIPMIIWATSPLEYAPFLAIKYKGGKKNQNEREGITKASILLLKEMLKTKDFPKTFFKYFDICYKGCLSVSPASKYLTTRFPKVKPIFFYEYRNWNPEQIREFVKDRVDWKIPGGKDDWHSDCLYHYFKEYMFLSMIGASYTDALLSNEIRYGIISREEALLKMEECNKTNSIGLLNSLKVLDLQQLENKIDFNVFSNNPL